MDRFIKEDVIEQVTSADKLFSVALTDCENHKEAAKVNLGFVADCMLKDLRSKKKVSEKQVFTVFAVAKLLEKCPLRYSLVQIWGGWTLHKLFRIQTSANKN